MRNYFHCDRQEQPESFVLIVVIMLLPWVGAAFADEVLIVSPSGLAETAGDRGLTSHFPVSPARLQYLHAYTDFVSLSPDTNKLAGYSIRLDETAVNPVAFAYPDLEIRLSTTTKNSLSTTFEENIGEDEVLVFSGDLRQSLPLDESLRGFGDPFIFDETFEYNPNDGSMKNLLIDLRFIGGIDAEGVSQSTLDQQSTPGVISRVGGRIDSLVGNGSEQIEVKEFIFITEPTGDFDGDGMLTIADVDRLIQEIVAGSDNARFDVNADALVDQEDLMRWVKDLKQTWFGDSNLDGLFNSGDLVAVFTAGEFEDDIEKNSTWAEGDWDSDGDFGSGDLVVAFQDGGFERGQRRASAHVPEPASAVPLMVGLLVIAIRWRHVAQ